ncbi:MAG TPA: AAA family ATPase [Gemmatimonadaceae bacterium]|nr:AAA family ATPase [Gemmatimonadaceae bacterium]
MFLRKLTLENFRSLRDVELSFIDANDDIRPWTMLLGENGTGKSSVLRAIALVLAGGQALPDLLGSVSQWITAGRKACVLCAELTTADGDIRSLRLELHPDDTIVDIVNRNAETMGQLESALRHSPRNYLVCGYGVSRRLPTGRRTAGANDSGFQSVRARSVATLFSADAQLTSLEAWALDVHYKLNDRGLTLIKQSLDGFLPDTTVEKVDRRGRRLMMRTPDGVLPLSQLSDGYQHVAAWVGDLLYRITDTFDDYKKPLSARGLLLIDELELHLHPLWQRQLRAFLTEKLPNFQIVATTHGALTAQQSGPGELFVFQRDAKSKESELSAFAGDPQQLLVHQLLMSDAFRLPTLNSPEVEAVRDEYEALVAKTRKTPAQKRRTLELARQLQDVPDPTSMSKTEQRNAKFVRMLAERLIPKAEREKALLENSAPDLDTPDKVATQLRLVAKTAGRRKTAIKRARKSALKRSAAKKK